MRETDSRSTLRLGFWSALLYAFLLVAFDIAFVGGTAPLAGGWVGIEAYARYHSPVDFIFSAIGLPMAFVLLVLLASVHYHSEGTSKVWSLLGLVFGAMYAMLLGALCFLQVGVVWPALARGATAGIEALALANPYSLVQALYYFAWGLGGLAFLCTGLVLRTRGLQRLAGWLLLLNGLANLALAPLYVLRRDLLLYVAGPSWALGLPLAAILLAAIYRRAAKAVRELP
jgi:predicted permease